MVCAHVVSILSFCVVMIFECIALFIKEILSFRFSFKVACHTKLWWGVSQSLSDNNAMTIMRSLIIKNDCWSMPPPHDGAAIFFSCFLIGGLGNKRSFFKRCTENDDDDDDRILMSLLNGHLSFKKLGDDDHD